jgi:uncharacterized repeat protein (TIGR01451 family)
MVWEKSWEKSRYAEVGDKIIYRISIKNNSSGGVAGVVKNITIKDILSNNKRKDGKNYLEYAGFQGGTTKVTYVKSGTSWTSYTGTSSVSIAAKLKMKNTNSWKLNEACAIEFVCTMIGSTLTFVQVGWTNSYSGGGSSYTTLGSGSGQHSSGTSYVVNGSGSNTSYFLRGDGTWQAVVTSIPTATPWFDSNGTGTKGISTPTLSCRDEFKLGTGNSAVSPQSFINTTEGKWIAIPIVMDGKGRLVAAMPQDISTWPKIDPE